jgi:hypothetical protein
MALERTDAQAGRYSMIFELSQRFYFEAAHSLPRERQAEEFLPTPFDIGAR